MIRIDYHVTQSQATGPTHPATMPLTHEKLCWKFYFETQYICKNIISYWDCSCIQKSIHMKDIKKNNHSSLDLSIKFSQFFAIYIRTILCKSKHQVSATIRTRKKLDIIRKLETCVQNYFLVFFFFLNIFLFADNRQ